jgi:hypothetical protein
MLLNYPSGLVIQAKSVRFDFDSFFFFFVALGFELRASHLLLARQVLLLLEPFHQAVLFTFLTHRLVLKKFLSTIPTLFRHWAIR